MAGEVGGSEASDPSSDVPPTQEQLFEDQAARSGLVLPRSRRTKAWQVAALTALIVGAAVGIGWLGHGFDPSSGANPLSLPSACSSPALESKGTLSTALDGSQLAAFQQLASAFGRTTGGCVAVSLNESSTTVGLASLKAGLVDFEAIGSPISAPDLAGLPYPAVAFPLVAGAVSVVYNLPASVGELNLSADVLAGICLGTIQNWTDPALVDLNPVLAHAATGRIVPIYLEGTSSTTADLTEYLSQTNETWRETVGTPGNVTWSTGPLASNTSALLEQVAATPGAIGFAADLNLTATTLGVARLLNPSGQFALPNVTGVESAASAAASENFGANISLDPTPTAANASGTWSYPLTTFSYVVMYQDLGRAYGGTVGLATAYWLIQFFEWATQRGNATLATLGLAPIPYHLALLTESVLQQVAYNGDSILLGPPDAEAGETGGETGEF